MDSPTAADVIGWSQLSFPEKGYPDEAAVQRLVDIATALFSAITGQTWALMPPEFEAMAQKAAQGLTEQVALEESVENLETLADFDLIQNFSAGPYSETRRTPADAKEARMINRWPWLNELLWMLLTPEKYDYWTEFFAGGDLPAWGVTEVEWGTSSMTDLIWGA